MYLQLKSLLKPEALSAISALTAAAAFSNGQATATGAAQAVKQNEQLPRESPASQEISQLIEQALRQSPAFMEAAFPQQIVPFLVSRYSPGMEYGWHVDSPLMQGGTQIIRADISITVFLSNADTYEGGELEIDTEAGVQLFKGNAGDAVSYPTTRLHRVRPVTSGTRLVAVSWVQSLIGKTEERELAFRLKSLQEMLGRQQQGSQAHLLSQQLYSNLLKMWL